MNGSSEVNLAAWCTAFQEIDQCPWPGPRPLTTDDPATLLAGRNVDSNRFSRLVQENRLILLDGVSGVGKTSLLSAKLVPDLRAAGYTVAYCSDWTDDGDLDAVSFLAEKIRAALPSELDNVVTGDLGEGPSFFGDLGREAGDRIVIVLDQFEELIRYSEQRTDETLKTLLVLNHYYDLRVVVSLRSEYLHHLRPLDRGAKAYTIAKYALDEVDDSFAKTLVTAPNDLDEVWIDDDEAQQIARLWQQARKPDSDASSPPQGSRIGLLHLQALLYVLHARSADGRITGDDVVEYRARISDASPAAVFAHAMADAVEIKLQRCEKACSELEVDTYLVAGTREVVARAAQHLSSGGFKLHRETNDLAAQVIGNQLAQLHDAIELVTEGAAREGAIIEHQELVLRHLIRAVIAADEHTGSVPPTQAASLGFDLLADGWQSIIGAIVEVSGDPTLRSWSEARSSDGQADPMDASSGPMMGMSPVAILVEELRRYAFALAWMRRTWLVRLSTPAPSRTVVSLIHDRFGEGMAAWARGVEGSPTSVLSSLTAPQGATLEWVGLDDDERARLGGDASHRLLLNLRLRGAWIQADFTRVLFVNCDFRGTMFAGCRFRGAVFMNCLLDGTMFTDCTVEGSAHAAGASAEWDEAPSRFVVRPAGERDQALMAGLARYRDDGQVGPMLYSPLPGLPAVPSDGNMIETTEWCRPDTGLLILGGRISSLVARNLTFEPADGERGTLSLHRVAGSGFDIVEQRSTARFDLFASVLRHLTLSTSDDDTADDVEFDIRGSALVQAWVGRGLTGSFDIADSIVVQAWNSSPTMRGLLMNSPYHDVVGFSVDEHSPALHPGEVALDLNDLDSKQVLDRGATADYRRDPALDERLERLAHDGRVRTTN